MINGIRVFDTILDSKNIRDTVSRNSSDFWKPFCKSAGWTFSHERVHSIKDLEFFFSRKIKEEVIIFSGHGDEHGFRLSNGEYFNGDEICELPEKNKGKVIIFSSCLMGKNAMISQKLKDFFSAQALFAYRHIMSDRFCFLNESILLTSIDHKLKKGNFTANDYLDFQVSTEFMKNMNSKSVKLHPMVMF